MGYVNLPVGRVTCPATVTAELDQQELQEVVRRLKSGLLHLKTRSQTGRIHKEGDATTLPPSSLQAPQTAKPAEKEIDSAVAELLPVQTLPTETGANAPDRIPVLPQGENVSKGHTETGASAPDRITVLPQGENESKGHAEASVDSEQPPARPSDSSSGFLHSEQPNPGTALNEGLPRSSLPSRTSTNTNDLTPTSTSKSDMFSEFSVLDYQQPSGRTSEDDDWTKISRPSAEEGSAPVWKEVWKSEPEEHDNNEVTALTYVPVIEGLSRDTGHGGWLVSASKQLLNLWECSPGRSDPYLQVMHSQMTDYHQLFLGAEMGTKMLFAASSDLRSKETCISLHSLQSNNILAPRGKLPVPPKGPTDRSHVQASFKVESLHSFGGPLANALAAFHDQQVFIFSLSPSLALKTSWQAHQAPVSQIHSSAYTIALFSAAKDGNISKWELRSKPRQAADTYAGFTSEVTGLHQISETTLLATCLDGEVAVWDVRNSQSPMISSKIPDNGRISTAAIIPEQGLFAVGTTTNKIYTFKPTNSKLHFEPAIHHTAPITSSKPAPSVLSWNSRTSHLYSISGSSAVIYSCA